MTYHNVARDRQLPPRSTQLGVRHFRADVPSEICHTTVEKGTIVDVCRLTYVEYGHLLFWRMSNTQTSPLITILEASKLVRRSERSLQRDINAALVAGQDAETKPAILEHLVLQLKEGDETRQVPGVDCNTSDAERARDEGKQPTWLLERSWTISEYGLKPSAPDASMSEAEVEDTNLSAEQDSQSVPGHGDAISQATRIETSALPDNVAFLKQRIVTLEQEKQVEVQRYEREVERNEKREQELFEQLKVKDKQISAWDEISQGLTKGLATGQLRPDQTLPATTQSRGKQHGNITKDAAEVVTVSEKDKETKLSSTQVASSEKNTTKSKVAKKVDGKAIASNKKRTKASASSKSKPKRKSKPKKKSSWKFW